MLKARSMHSLATESGTKLVNKIFEDSNIKEHSLRRIKEEAEKGLFLYEFSFRQTMLSTIVNLLLDKIKPIIEEFEENEFKVVVKSDPTGSWNYVSVVFYWGFDYLEYERIVDKRDRFSEKTKVLYYTR